MNLGLSSWTDERVARMKELHAAGHSASEIAADLGGVSRNAVCGKLDRLGITRGSKPGIVRAPRPRREPRITFPKPRQAPPPRENKSAHQRMADAAELAEFFATETGPAEGGVTFAALDKQHCRWPLGDPSDLETFRFCGEQRGDDGPYCEHHHRMSVL